VNYLEAKLRLDRSAALRLLKADNAALCIAFLYQVFRVERAVTREQFEMVSRLTTVLDEINGNEEPKKFPREAKDYVDKWVSDGVLHTRYGEGNNVIYELTPEADQAILFYQRLEEPTHGTRGAQSKLRTVLDGLQRIYRGANPDKDARLAEIEQQIAALADEKIRLKSGGEIKPFTTEQMAEEYHFVVEMAGGLLADFSLIRRMFLLVALELAERYAAADTARGPLLERALKAHRELHNGSLGQSFAAFREYLSADETQSSLVSLIRSMESIPAIAEEMRKDQFLPRLPSNLVAEAKEVINQTRRLSSDLRQMLEASAISSRRELHDVLNSVKSLAYSMADDPPEEDLITEVYLPWAELTNAEAAFRQPWRPPDNVEPVGESRPRANDEAAAIAAFATLAAVDIERLTNLLKARFDAEDHGFRLTEMLTWHPPREGEWVLDVIAYLEIARDPRNHHVIKPSQIWHYTPPGTAKVFTLPQIYFYK
jgi:polyhydroxyalkanoate synthesis regulator phasin